MAKRLPAAILTACALTLLAAACGGDDGETVVDGRVDIPHTAIDALTNYRFTSNLKVSSKQGDLKATFDGVFEAPDRFQGVLEASGDLYTFFERPRKVEFIVVTERTWWREPAGQWQSGVIFGENGQEAIDPFLIFTSWATPKFYLTALKFETFPLAFGGSEQSINDVETYPPSHFDKKTLLSFLRIGTFAPEGDKDPTVVSEDAAAFLPEDFAVDVWIAKEALYPARIVVSFSAPGDGFDYFFQGITELRLQMDITDPAADLQIVPPLPIEATLTP